MALDNKLSHSIKRLEVESPILSKRCRGSGKPLFSNSMGIAHLDQAPPSTTSSSSSSLVPKPFPPPSLAGIPLQYVLDQLHLLAPRYWNKPATADCTLVIPVPYPRKEGHSLPFCSRPSYDPSGLGRRVTEPSLNLIPRLHLKLHTDYLSAHSGFLRGLFSGASPFDLNTTTTSLNSPLRTSSGRFIIPADRLPRLLPASTPEHPVLFLPVPDPTSIDHLIHWMYFGETSYIERDLRRGTIEWEGIARNVEYLGLSSEIKVFLGRWYGRWLHPERRAFSNSPTYVGHEDEDDCSSDTLYSEEDDDEADYDIDDDDVFYDSASDTAEDVEMETDHDGNASGADKEPTRGRPLWNHRRPPSWNIPFVNENASCNSTAHPPTISPLDPPIPSC